MQKKEYAEAVGTKLYGEGNFIVRDVFKNGVTLTGVCEVKKSGVSPTYYVDEAFDDGVEVDDFVNSLPKPDSDSMKEVEEITEKLFNFDAIKDLLTVRLFNASVGDGYAIKRSASRFGFDDLIMIPSIEGKDYGVIVGKDLMKNWGKTADEVFKVCLENLKNSKTVIKSMEETICEIMGMTEEEVIEQQGGVPSGMYVVSNESKKFGAANILYAKKELGKIFPKGYVVIPSSVHELIVVAFEGNIGMIEDMIKEVNDTTVNEIDRLSYKAYVFKA